MAKIELEAEEIEHLVREAVEKRGPIRPGTARFTGPGPINQMLRIGQERLSASPDDSLAQHALNLRQQQSERSLHRQIVQEHETPLGHAMHALHLGAGLMEQKGPMGLFAHISGNIGQFAEVFKTLGPVVGPIVIGLAAVGIAAKLAAERLEEVGSAMMISGGTGAETEMGRMFAGMIGADPKGIAGMARAVRQSISPRGGDFLAQAAAQEVGVSTTPIGMGRPPDEMKILLQMIQRGILAPRRGEEGDRDARLFAERTHMEQFLPLREMPKDMIEQFNAMAESAGKLDTEGARESAARLQGAIQGVSEGFGMLKQAIGMPFLTVLAQSAAGLEDLGLSILKLFGIGPGGFRQRHAGEGEHQSATKEHTEAMKAHSEELRLNRTGTFGGGSRAQQAIPPGLRGDSLEQALRQQAIRLGAF